MPPLPQPRCRESVACRPRASVPALHGGVHVACTSGGPTSATTAAGRWLGGSGESQESPASFGRQAIDVSRGALVAVPAGPRANIARARHGWSGVSHRLATGAVHCHLRLARSFDLLSGRNLGVHRHGFPLAATTPAERPAGPAATRRLHSASQSGWSLVHGPHATGCESLGAVLAVELDALVD